MAELNHHLSISWHSKAVKRSTILLILGLVLLYGLIPNLHSLFGLELRLRLPDQPQYLFASALAIYATFIFSSTSYRILALKKLKFKQVLLVQYSGATLNLFLPAGIGAISLNYLFLRSMQLSKTASGLIVALNNALGIAGNISLLFIFSLIFGINNKLLNVFGNHKSGFILVLLIIALIFFLLLLFLNSSQVVARRARSNILDAFNLYRHPSHWWRLFGAYCCALTQAAIMALAFWFALKAFHVEIDYPLTFLIFSVSVLVGGLFPTPGGLGGVEASLVASIVAVHGANTSIALSSVLGYRAISYWLPAATGSVALFFVRKMKLVKLS